jgi:hypothetical protein
MVVLDVSTTVTRRFPGTFEEIDTVLGGKGVVYTEIVFDIGVEFPTVFIAVK